MRDPALLLVGLVVAASAAAGVAAAESPAAGGRPAATVVLAARAIPLAGGPIEDAAIVVEGDRILAIGPRGRIRVPDGASRLDLGGLTVLPGLIDAHTHILLQGDPTAASYEDQILRESLPLRTIRGTVAAGIALRHGFTTLRDLGTEGALYADVAIRDAIDKGYIEGPRLKVAARALASTGSYPLLGFPFEVVVPVGVQTCDGSDACRQAVREQIKYGADWIKVYVDRSYYLAGDGHLDSLPDFTQAELDAIVGQAHAWRRRVAAHAVTRTGVGMALAAGVDSIEHGQSIEEPHAREMAAKGIYHCPTLTVGDYVAAPRAAEGREIWKKIPQIARESFRRTRALGVKIVFGTDAGGFPWQEIHQARELATMVELGMSPEEALRSATTVAAGLLQMEDDVGALAPGRYADLIAVAGDPLADIRLLQDVRFVMKGGRVVLDASRPAPGARPGA